MNVHLIAIGGSVMHNMALALKSKGYNVTGSDDNIFEPSRSRLEKAGILPKKMGWFPEKISVKLDAIILAMHARIDNPELNEAKKLNIPIYSFPEYIYNESKHKKRIVIGGSHGKTSITAMILHVLNDLKIDADYMIGAQIEGFETMVKITKDAPIIILEGDEYLSSAIDRRPKFHLYQPHIAVLSGIAWDHINVFPTLENYIEQFKIFKNKVKETLIYYSKDKNIQEILKDGAKCKLIPYDTPDYIIKDGKTIIDNTELLIFGSHNMENLTAAKIVCTQLGIKENVFYKSIKNFKGASKRLELIKKSSNYSIYKDFAHSPSKLCATINAVKEQFPSRKLIACMELHTFSSLNSKFLSQYENSMSNADIAIIYYNPDSISRKKLVAITEDQIRNSFSKENLLIFKKSEELKLFLRSINWKEKNLLMMSSGDFNGINFETLIL